MSTQQADARRSSSAGLTTSAVLRFWLPLATSWLLMATENLAVNAIIARTAETKLQLAALGIAFSLALAVESPIISLLTTSNALARDWQSFRLLQRFTLGLNAAVTTAMLLLGLTPLFDLVVVQLIGTPTEIAFKVCPVIWTLTLWPAAIGFRRFHQGLMIRHGYTRQIGYGTAIRLFTGVGVSLAGLAWGKLEGATVGGLALGASSIAESAYVWYVAQPAVQKVKRTNILAEKAPLTPPLNPPQLWEGSSLTLGDLLRFYAPLALMSAITLSTTPLINSGLSRSPYPVESLAAWPVVSGQLFALRSFGLSLQEVVVALLDGSAAMKTLRRFATMVGVGSLALLLIIAYTPLAPWWQQQIAGLSEDLTVFAVAALRLAVLLPVLAVVVNMLRGIVVTGKATSSIAQATVLNLLALGSVLLIGARLGLLPGASLAAVALTVSQLTESAWLWHRARPYPVSSLEFGVSS
jgi:hypothetical protein